MSYLKAALIAGVLTLMMLIGGGLVWGVMNTRLQTVQNELQEAQARVKALTLAQKAQARGDAVREAQRASALAQAKEARNALNQALAAHRDWADQPVPDDVARVLQRPAVAP
jgi:multidrug resistance efflux pump